MARPKLVITGNGRTFADAEDLTDVTYQSLLKLLEFQLMLHSPRGGDHLTMLIALVNEVRQAAWLEGWSQEASENLAAAAGILFGSVVGDAIAETLPGRLRPRRG